MKTVKQYQVRIEHEKRAHVYAPNGKYIDTAHSADVNRIIKQHKAKITKLQ